MAVERRKNHILARVRTIYGETRSYRWPLDKYHEAVRWHDAAKEACRNGVNIPPPDLYGSTSKQTLQDKFALIRSPREISKIRNKSTWTLEEAFLFVCNTRWAEVKAREKVKQHWEIISSFFGARTKFHQLTILEVDEFVEMLKKKRGNSGGSVNRKLSTLSTMWKETYLRGKAPKRVEPWPLQKESSGRTRYYSLAEERAIFEACRSYGDQEMLEYLMLLLDTGMRRGELESLTPLNYEEKEQVIILNPEQTKTSQARLIYLTPRALPVIERRVIDCLDPDEKLFPKKPSWYLSHWKYVRDMAGIEDGCMHTFRHTFASRHAMAGSNSLTLQTLMGHKSIVTTRRYAHLSFEAQRDAMQKVLNSKHYDPNSHLGYDADWIGSDDQ